MLFEHKNSFFYVESDFKTYPHGFHKSRCKVLVFRYPQTASGSVCSDFLDEPLQGRHTRFLSLRIMPEELQQHPGILRLVYRFTPRFISRNIFRPLRSTHSLTSLPRVMIEKILCFYYFTGITGIKKAPIGSKSGVNGSTFRIFGVFQGKRKRTPVAGIPWLRLWIFDVTKNVTKWVKIGVNRCNMETENPNILCVNGVFTTKYWGFQILAEKERFELSRRYSRPTPLAGAPLRPLEYFSEYSSEAAVCMGFRTFLLYYILRRLSRLFRKNAI